MPRARPVRGCARGFCGLPAPVAPLRPSAPPRRPAASLRSAAAGPAPGLRGFGPRFGPWGLCAPLRRAAPRRGSVGLGLSAAARARRSGPPSPPPPRPRRPFFPWAWAAGAAGLARAGPSGSPCARCGLPGGRPCSAPGSPGPLARLGLVGAPPPGPPLRGGFALAPPRGGARAAAARPLSGRVRAPPRFFSRSIWPWPAAAVPSASDQEARPPWRRSP